MKPFRRRAFPDSGQISNAAYVTKPLDWTGTGNSRLRYYINIKNGNDFFCHFPSVSRISLGAICGGGPWCRRSECLRGLRGQDRRRFFEAVEGCPHGIRAHVYEAGIRGDAMVENVEYVDLHKVRFRGDESTFRKIDDQGVRHCEGGTSREITEQWIKYYNNERPHDALNNKAPMQYRLVKTG